MCCSGGVCSAFPSIGDSMIRGGQYRRLLWLGTIGEGKLFIIMVSLYTPICLEGDGTETMCGGHALPSHPTGKGQPRCGPPACQDYCIRRGPFLFLV